MTRETAGERYKERETKRRKADDGERRRRRRTRSRRCRGFHLLLCFC